MSPKSRITNHATEAEGTYDGSGRRSTKAAAGVAHTYIYDGPEIVEERISSGQTLNYLHGPGIDRHLAQRDQAGNVAYYLRDHLESVAQVTSSSGAVTMTREYDPWGNPLQGAALAGYSFTGRDWDPETSLYYYRARYYHPSVGRFLGEDPVRSANRRTEELNGYAYVANRPTIATDPSGQFLWVCARLADDPLGILVFAMHVYLWSDKTAPHSCGYKSPRGSLLDVGPSRDQCTIVPGTKDRDKEECGIKCCREGECQSAPALKKNVSNAQSFSGVSWYRNCWDTVTCALTHARLPVVFPNVPPYWID